MKESGRITLSRFAVVGDPPGLASMLDLCGEHRFMEREIGAPDEVEAGWVTGQHLLDTRFDHRKNVFDPNLLIAMRVDTHKVPADLKKAYRQMNEQAAAEGNPSGFASKAQKREAQEVAGRQIREEMASGKFRRSRMAPVLWSPGRRELCLGASGNTITEELGQLMRQTFGVELELNSAGRLAGQILRQQGRGHDWEDLHPTPFTPPPAAAGDGEQEATIPAVPWVATSVDPKDFLGSEFLLWLWHRTERTEGCVSTPIGDLFVAIDKALDFECAWGVGGRVNVRGGNPTRTREAGKALQAGKWLRKVGLVLTDAEHQWELSLAADTLSINSAALPEVEQADSPHDLIRGRIDLTHRLLDALDAMYRAFLSVRVSDDWPACAESIRTWIGERG